MKNIVIYLLIISMAAPIVPAKAQQAGRGATTSVMSKDSVILLIRKYQDDWREFARKAKESKIADAKAPAAPAKSGTASAPAEKTPDADFDDEDEALLAEAAGAQAQPGATKNPSLIYTPTQSERTENQLELEDPATITRLMLSLDASIYLEILANLFEQYLSHFSDPGVREANARLFRMISSSLPGVIESEENNREQVATLVTLTAYIGVLAWMKNRGKLPGRPGRAVFTRIRTALQNLRKSPPPVEGDAVILLGQKPTPEMIGAPGAAPKKPKPKLDPVFLNPPSELRSQAEVQVTGTAAEILEGKIKNIVPSSFWKNMGVLVGSAVGAGGTSFLIMDRWWEYRDTFIDPEATLILVQAAIIDKTEQKIRLLKNRVATDFRGIIYPDSATREDLALISDTALVTRTISILDAQIDEIEEELAHLSVFAKKFKGGEINPTQYPGNTRLGEKRSKRFQENNSAVFEKAKRQLTLFSGAAVTGVTLDEASLRSFSNLREVVNFIKNWEKAGRPPLAPSELLRLKKIEQ